MSATPFQLDSACLPIHRLAAFEHTILDGIQDLLLVLAPDGRVLHASQMCLALTTLTPEHLIGNHITTFMHYDDLPVFLEEFNANMLEGKPWRYHHRLRRADGTFTVFESTLNPFIDKTAFQTTGFFGLRKCLMTIRPYLNPSVALLDSYLDHITTQARLVKQLKQLRSDTEESYEKEEEEEEEEEEEAMDEHTLEGTHVRVPSTKKTKKKVSSIGVLSDLTNMLLGPFQDRNRPSFRRSFTKTSPRFCPGRQPRPLRVCGTEAREE
jgi:PAS domain S-box-containing protein